MHASKISSVMRAPASRPRAIFFRPQKDDRGTGLSRNSSGISSEWFRNSPRTPTMNQMPFSSVIYSESGAAFAAGNR